jgi:hypothetical protein
LRYGQEETVVTFVGLIVCYILLALGKLANWLNIGPQWLRRFEIDRNTFY